jgi:hypothetical protein
MSQCIYEIHNATRQLHNTLYFQRVAKLRLNNNNIP